MSYVSKNPRFTTTSVTDSTTGSISSPPSGVDKIINRNGVLYLKNSAGGETPIGSSSGGKNYLAKQSDASAAVGTVSLVAAGGNISVSGTFPNVSSAWYADAGLSPIAISPDNTLRGTSNYLTALTSFDAAGAVYVQTPAFNIDGEDLGKALAVQFDVAGNTTANDWDVVAVRYTSAGVFGALIPIAGIASTTTGTASAQVPTGTTTFRGFFITGSTASDVYSIRWRRRAGAVAIRFDNLIVGPNSVMLGTAITDWQSYTPASYQGLGTPTSVEIQYRRVGDSVEVKGKLTTGTVAAAEVRVALPSSLTSAGVSVIPTIQVAGDWYRNAASVSNGFAVLIEPSVTYFTIGQFTNSQVVLTKATGSGNLSSTEVQVFHAKIPISTYSSNVTMADRAVEEYASNGAAAGVSTNDTTDFKYGPAGSQIGAITAGHYKRVRFQTVVQATDNIIVELRDPQTNVWSALGNSFATQSFGSQVVPWSISGSTQVGMGRLAPFSSTDVDVYFASVPSAGTGAVWGTGAGSMGSCFWRCRKVSGGAAVGFPVGARNVIGDTTGTAVPAGYIGETLTQSRLRGALTSLTTGVPLNVLATPLTLTPGVWSLTGTVAYKTATSTSVTAIFAAINTTSATIPATTSYAVPSSTGQIAVSRETSATVYGSGDNNLILPPQTIVVSTSTIYYLVAQGNFTVSTLDAYGFISAVRIA